MQYRTSTHIAPLVAALLLVAAPHAARATQPGTPVTEANLLANDRFWPYQVALVEDWAPAMGTKPLRAKTQGVLIRVEDSGVARVDFGRDGRFEVPVARTDLVARANRIRTGEDSKTVPNFLMALGPRLVDSSGDQLRAFPLERSILFRAFVTVFVDPATPAFEEIAVALAPLATRVDVLTIVLPQGEHPDARVREQLRAAQWTVPFVYDHLAEPYTKARLRPELTPPVVQLQTPEGRLLYESSWTAKTAAELRAAVDAALGAPSTPQKETPS